MVRKLIWISWSIQKLFGLCILPLGQFVRLRSDEREPVAERHLLTVVDHFVVVGLAYCTVYLLREPQRLSSFLSTLIVKSTNDLLIGPAEIMVGRLHVKYLLLIRRLSVLLQLEIH